MQEIATLKFQDLASADEGVAVCRATSGMVGLCLSLCKGADVEVFLSADDCRTLLDALSQALNVAEKPR
jgi:hypothetical protein